MSLNPERIEIESDGAARAGYGTVRLMAKKKGITVCLRVFGGGYQVSLPNGGTYMSPDLNDLRDFVYNY